MQRAIELGDVARVSELRAVANIRAPRPDASDVFSGRTALHNAAIFGRVSLVPMLFAAGANINARDIYGNTPLHYVGQEPRPDWEVATALIAAGADACAKNLRGSVACPPTVLRWIARRPWVLVCLT